MATKFVKPGNPRSPHRRLAVFDYRNTTIVKDAETLRRIYGAWQKRKSPLGYATYTDIYVLTRIPYAKIFGVLKWFQKENPRGVHFNINRYGKNIFFKFDTKVV